MSGAATSRPDVGHIRPQAIIVTKARPPATLVRICDESVIATPGGGHAEKRRGRLWTGVYLTRLGSKYTPFFAAF